MNIFEINKQMLNLYEMASDYEKELIENNIEGDEALKQWIITEWNNLEMAKAEKIDNTISLYKSLDAKIEALKAHKKEIDERIRIDEKTIARIANLIEYGLGGEKFENVNHKITYRKSESVEILNETLIDRKFFNEKTTYTPDKKAIKSAIELGEIIHGATIVKKNNIQIK